MTDADVMERSADGEAVPETASKSEFAAMCGVTAGRVSQWISEGKITPASLVGEGRSARVNVRAAVGELSAKLDISQSVGLNGLASRLAISKLAATSPSAATPRPEPDAVAALPPGGDGSGADLFDAPGEGGRDLPRADATAEAIAREKLRQQELRTAQMEREDALQIGRYVLAEESRARIGRTAATVLNAVEAGFNTMADDLCARFPDLPRRDVLHALTTSFRKVRERAARDSAEKRDQALRAAEAGDAEDE